MIERNLCCNNLRGRSDLYYAIYLYMKWAKIAQNKIHFHDDYESYVLF